MTSKAYVYPASVNEPANTYDEPANLSVCLSDEENEVYEVNFHFNQFFTALIIHLIHTFCGPFSLLVLRCVFGRPLISNMAFSLRPWYVVELLGHFVLLLNILLLVLKPERAIDFEFVAITSLTTVFLRLFMVCFKYGTFSAKWWRKINADVLTTHELTNTLLLLGWRDVPSDLATEELVSALNRLPLLYTNLHLIFRKDIPSSVREKLDQLEENMVAGFFCPVDVIPNQYEPAYFVARLLIDDALLVKRKMNIAPLLLSISYSIIPFVMRLSLIGISSFQCDVFELLLTPLSWLISWFVSYIMLEFIIVGIIDFERKKLLMSQCSALISDLDHIYLLDEIPKLDMKDPRSILAWYYMRRAFLDFGQRFSLRIHLYASLIVPILIGSVVILLLQMADVIGNTYNLELIPPLCLTIAFDYVIVKMILAALDLNSTFQVHSDLLQEAMSRLSDVDSEAGMVLQWAIRKLEVDLVLRPVKILGFTIDDGMVNKLIALGISGGFALLQRLAN